MHVDPYIPLSIWTTPRLNRQQCGMRRRFLEERQKRQERWARHERESRIFETLRQHLERSTMTMGDQEPESATVQ